jgi:hypothetical protein
MEAEADDLVSGDHPTHRLPPGSNACITSLEPKAD